MCLIVWFIFHFQTAIQNALDISHHCICILKDYGMAIFTYDNNIYFFDPHARNTRNALCHEDGKAVLVKFTNISTLCTHIRALTPTITKADLSGIQVDITPIVIMLETPQRYSVPKEKSATETVSSYLASQKLIAQKRSSVKDKGIMLNTEKDMTSTYLKRRHSGSEIKICKPHKIQKKAIRNEQSTISQSGNNDCQTAKGVRKRDKIKEAKEKKRMQMKLSRELKSADKINEDCEKDRIRKY